MLARWAARKTTLSLFRGNNLIFNARHVMYRPTKLVSPRTLFLARAFSTHTVQRNDAPKTYFQPGDKQYARSIAEYRAPAVPTVPVTATPAATTTTTTSSPDRPRPYAFGPTWLNLGVQLLGWATLFPIILIVIVLLYDFATNGYESVINKIAILRASAKHKAAASGTHELFSLMLLHIMDTGTLYDAYRDDDLLETDPLVLDGVTVTAQNGGVVVRVVDSGGRTRMIILAVDATDIRSRLSDNNGVSNSTPIDVWLLALSNKIYRENNEGEVGLTLMFFTRDTMGIGPVGGEEGMALMQYYPYDATAEDSYGSMVDVLKEVKTEKRELVKPEEEAEETDKEEEDRLESLQQSLGEVIEEIEP